MIIKPPVSNVLTRVYWLSAPHPQDWRTGSGVAVHVGGVEYLITAHHVVELNDQPSIRYGGSWRDVAWDSVVMDKERDLAVLKPKEVIHPERHHVLYGEVKGLVHGQIGYALGYPYLNVDDDISKYVLETNKRTIPIPALVLAVLSADAELSVAAGHINAGFSGGAVVFPVEDEWTLAGMVANYHAIARPVLVRNDQGQVSDDDKEHDELYFEDHVGFVGYLRWSAIEHAIEIATR